MVKIGGDESDSSCEVIEFPSLELVRGSSARKRRKVRRCASGLGARFIERDFVVGFFEGDSARARRAGEVFDSLRQRRAPPREWIHEFADLMSSDSSDDESALSRYQMGRREFAPRAESYILTPTDLNNKALEWVDREVLGIVSNFATKGGRDCGSIEILAEDELRASGDEASGSEDGSEQVVESAQEAEGDHSDDSMSSGNEVEDEEDEGEGDPKICWAEAPGLDDRVCHPAGTKAGCMGFYMYEAYFRRIGLRFPLSEFEIGVLSHLQVAPSQLHPNAWGFIRAFQIFCRARSMVCTPRLFFWLFTVRHSTNADEEAAKRRGWTTLQAQNGCSMFSPACQSFKDWKQFYFKVHFQPSELGKMTSPGGEPCFPFQWCRGPEEFDPKVYLTSDKDLDRAERAAAKELAVWIQDKVLIRCSLLAGGDQNLFDEIVSMASKKEMAILLAQQKKTTGGKKDDSSSSASVPKVVLKAKPIRTVPPAAKKLKTLGAEETPAVDPPLVDLSADRGKTVVSEGVPPPASGVAYPSPSFSGAGLPLSVPPMLDARLLDDGKAEYLKTFPPQTLFKQMKGMAVFTATVLKYFETSSSWDDSIKLEKERLQKLAEGKMATLQASFNKDLGVAQKAKEEAERKAADESRLKAEERRLKEEAEGRVASLTEQLSGVQEEARQTRERLAKVEEELAAKVEALRLAGEKVGALEEEKQKLAQAATSTWANAQEQVLLFHPGIDLSRMVMEGWVEDGELWYVDEEGVCAKVDLSGPGSS